MALLPLALATLLALDAANQPLSREIVLRHLKIGPRGENDGGDPEYVPRSGNAYLAACGKRCHAALFDVLADLEKGKLQTPKDVPVRNIFIVLTRQTCDRSQFVPHIEKYALAGRGETKLTESAHCYALTLLGQIGGAEHVQKLIPLVLDDDRSVGRAALAAIVKLGDERHRDLVAGLLAAEMFNLDTSAAQAEKRVIDAAVKALDEKPAPPAKPKK